MKVSDVGLLLKWAVSPNRGDSLPPIPNETPEACLMELLVWTRVTTGKEFSDCMKALGPQIHSELFQGINARRGSLGAHVLSHRQYGLLAKDLVTFARAAAFALSRRCYSDLSAEQKKTWLKAWLPKKSFLELCEEAPLVDECIDRVLGMDEREVKKQVASHKKLPKAYQIQDIYLAHESEHLYTPYRIIRQILAQLKLSKGETLADLGSGAGRLGVYLGIFRPELNFVGYELMVERHEQAARCHQELQLPPNVRFECRDLAAVDFEIPYAQTYFMFNPFSRRTLQKVFAKLKRTAERENKFIRIVMINVGRPPLWVSREPWLQKIYKSKADPTWDGLGFSIYGLKRSGKRR